MPVEPYTRAGELERFDERDNVQSRNGLEPGTDDYHEFYGRHPEWEARDADNRELSKTRVGHRSDVLLFLQQIGRLAKSGREECVDGPVASQKVKLSPERAAEKLKGFALHLGADLARCGPLNPAFIYTHVGKTWHDPARRYAAPITLDHTHAISIAVALRPEQMQAGPVLSMISEVMRAYTQLDTVTTTLAAYIRSLGYRARAHVLCNYQVLCIPVAIEAGMGQLGRHGVMVTRELGSNLKLATVTTELGLAQDPPIDLGIDEFCQDCKICAETCPSGAISFGGKKVIRGVEKWAINPQACYRVWQETGTDCGVCLASCPWNKPRTAFHRFCTVLATKKHKAGWWMSLGEKLFYGKFRPNAGPAYFEKPEPIWKKYRPFRQD
jgi:reductive dehalogenase